MLTGLASALGLLKVWEFAGELVPSAYVIRVAPGLPVITWQQTLDGYYIRLSLTERTALRTASCLVLLAETLVSDEMRELLDEEDEDVEEYDE